MSGSQVVRWYPSINCRSRAYIFLQGQVYQKIIDDVINDSASTFDEDGVERRLLDDLKAVSGQNSFLPGLPCDKYRETCRRRVPRLHIRYPESARPLTWLLERIIAGLFRLSLHFSKDEQV